MTGRALRNLLLLVFTIAYLGAIVSSWVMFRWTSVGPEAADRGRRLFGWNPVFSKLVGFHLLRGATAEDSQRAVEAFLTALRLSPADQDSWDGLADAYTRLGDSTKLEAALRAGMRAGPYSPKASWRWANFLILHNRPDEALPYLRITATSDKSLRPAVYSLGWKLLGDAGAVITRVVPTSVDARVDYGLFLLQQKRYDEAYGAWRLVNNSQEPPATEFGYYFIEVLSGIGRGRQAAAVWDDLLKLQGKAWVKPDQELVTNGDFEAELTGRGLDWRNLQTPDYDSALDSFVVQNGARSLRVRLTGRVNPDFHGPAVSVPVESNRLYLLRAYIRTEKIPTQSGVRFMVYGRNPDSGRTFSLLTPSRSGTGNWIAEQLCFRTPDDIQMVSIGLRRLQDPFDATAAFSGTVWIDGVSLASAENVAACTADSLRRD